MGATATDRSSSETGLNNVARPNGSFKTACVDCSGLSQCDEVRVGRGRSASWLESRLLDDIRSS